jgi:hypothetical protein
MPLVKLYKSDFTILIRVNPAPPGFPDRDYLQVFCNLNPILQATEERNKRVGHKI